MERNDIHELTAPYALDALDAEETKVFEDHLRRCEQCREEVAALREVTALLAHDAPPLEPPTELRGRILDAARVDRGNVVPLRPRWAAPAAAVAAIAACAAVGFGLWAASLHHTLGHRDAALHSQTQALQIAATPGARNVALSGGSGVLVVAPSGRAALILSGLAKPPSGKIFEAWVISGKRAQPAGLFSQTTAVTLKRTVPKGSIVAVTIEHSGGVPQPTTTPILTSGAA